MEYRQLSSIYYADQTSSRDSRIKDEHKRRFEAESTFRLGFDTPQGELFVAVPRELTVLAERVLRTERKISNLVHGMPAAASYAVLRNLVLDEVVSTNAIEEIQSTRKQIKEALEARNEKPTALKRFRELATLYLNMIDGKDDIPSRPEEIRAIYDEVTRGEIPHDKQPDGRLFRAQGVSIVQNGANIVHRGIEPESKIIESLQKMLDIVHSPDVPALYRAIIGHYLFEYIHPFYDGNGRTGRYLLSLTLSESLSPATALSLSRIIAENRIAYYKAFKTTEKPLNRGELTFFVHAILRLIREAQLQLEERLEGNRHTLNEIFELMERIRATEKLKEKETQIVFMLLQYDYFDISGDASLLEISDHIGLKTQMTRKYLRNLEARNIVRKQHQRNPLTFRISEAFKDKYGVSVPQND